LPRTVASIMKRGGWSAPANPNVACQMIIAKTKECDIAARETNDIGCVGIILIP
jgi:hypothetical protein